MRRFRDVRVALPMDALRSSREMRTMDNGRSFTFTHGQKLTIVINDGPPIKATFIYLGFGAPQVQIDQDNDPRAVELSPEVYPLRVIHLRP